MSETIISPGVLTRENDISFQQPEPQEIGTLFIGPAVKGPVEIPTVITSYGEYVNKFGTTFQSGSSKEEYLTSIAVRNFFQRGGNTALITRVVSGSYSRATSTNIAASTGSYGNSFTLETIGKGTIYNNSTGTGDPGQQNADSSLISGSSDNIRWEIANVNNARGTFSLFVRRGDDNRNSKVILESFNNLSLDPESTNYIERVVGNQVKSISGDSTYIATTGSYRNNSNYIRVSNVLRPTLNYLGNDGITVRVDSNNTSYSASLPLPGSGSFYGATGVAIKGGENYYNGFTASDTQGLIPSSYDKVITLLTNRDDYQFNVVATPGLLSDEHSSTVNKIISMVEERGDAIYIVDTADYGDNIGAVTTNAQALNSSYAGTYFPYIQVRSETGKDEFVPPSCVIPGVYAFNDSRTAPWFAAAGFTRGALEGVVGVERKLSAQNRNDLYVDNVNPIATFPGVGLVVYGQKTLQKSGTSLEGINVRRLLIELKGFIGNEAKKVVFQQNTVATRNRFLSIVNPYLESVVQREGLYSYRVVMDDTNNTSDVIDRKQLVGQIFIQPTQTAEFVVLDFTIEPTGATFVA